MLKILCKACNTELISHSTQAKSCGCSNMTMIVDDKITALDLSLVQIISGVQKQKTTEGVLSSQDLAFQEERRKRKVRKLEFEVR
jgi:hypothetical protein